MKKVARQFALSHDLSYELIESYYTGSLIDGGGTSCQNCGKVITSVAVVRDSAGVKHTIGMDCAATLAGLPGSLPFEAAQEAVSYAKKLRAALKRFFAEFGDEAQVASYTPRAVAKLEGTQIIVVTSEQCQYFADKRRARNRYNLPAKYWESHILPMCREFITTPEQEAALTENKVAAAA
jgi:hypothetical protein